MVNKEVILTTEDAVQNLRLKIGKRPECDGVHIAYLWIDSERDDAMPYLNFCGGWLCVRG